MAQITSGIRAILSLPAAYELFEALVGAERCRACFVCDHVHPTAGQRILDVGCGPATILAHLPEVEYCGYDISVAYIEAARRRFGARGQFIAAPLTEHSLDGGRPYDLALAIGLLHHLADAEAAELLRICRAALVSGGRLVTLDPCFDSAQAPIARRIISWDRGRNVRTLEGYRRLATDVFTNTSAHLRHDLLRIPYTHAILECQA